MSDSEEEMSVLGKKSAPKRKAQVISDDDSFIPEPVAMEASDADSPAPPLKVPEPAWVWQRSQKELCDRDFLCSIKMSLQEEESDKNQINRETNREQVEL